VRTAAILVLPALLALAFMRALTLTGLTSPLEPPPAVVWSGRLFADPGSLEAWLHSRGGTYERWAVRHPGAAERLGRPPARSLGAAQTAAVPRVHEARLPGVDRDLVAALAAALALAATVAATARAAASPRVRGLVRANGGTLAAGGVSVGVGLAIGILLA
jgi:hypothetical protein